MTIDEMIEVLQAHKSGKPIQRRGLRIFRTASDDLRGLPNADNQWEDAKSPEFNFMMCEYRVKPEPIVLWVNFWDNGLQAHKSRQQAVDSVRTSTSCRRCAVKFIECEDQHNA